MEVAAASLTGGDAGEERWRGGGATAIGGVGPRLSPAARCGEGGGRVRRGMGRGGVDDAPPVKNRRGTHRGRRIGGDGSSGAAAAMEGARV